MSRFHFIATAAWALLLVPTLIWWRESILWVATMSLYANFIGHFSAYHAAKAERKEEELETKIKELHDMVKELHDMVKELHDMVKEFMERNNNGP